MLRGRLCSRLQLKVKVLWVKVMNPNVAVLSSAAVAAQQQHRNKKISCCFHECVCVKGLSCLTSCRQGGKQHSWWDRNALWPFRTPPHRQRGRTWEQMRLYYYQCCTKDAISKSSVTLSHLASNLPILVEVVVTSMASCPPPITTWAKTELIHIFYGAKRAAVAGWTDTFAKCCLTWSIIGEMAAELTGLSVLKDLMWSRELESKS